MSTPLTHGDELAARRLAAIIENPVRARARAYERAKHARLAAAAGLAVVIPFRRRATRTQRTERLDTHDG
jgi:hypothetical protein